MCSQIDVINEVISEKTNAGEMFTAYDVTVAARKKVNNFIDRHNKIKKDVHNAFVNNEMPTLYVRTLVGLQDANKKVSEVYMYHYLSENPTDYQPSNPALKVVSIDGDTVDGIDDSDEEEEDEYCKDKDGRLNIPQKLLKKAGLNAFRDVFIINDKDTVLVSVWDNFNSPTLSVNADGRVRLNKLMLENLTEPYKMTVKMNTVVVSSK